MRQSVNNYFHDYREAAVHYTYTSKDVEKGPSSTKISVSEVMAVNGVPYERTVSRDGGPLPPAQDAKEQAKLEKRKNESAAEQAKQLREYQAGPAFLEEVPNAFLFTMLPEETVDGRPNYVIECRPNPSYHPHNSRAAMFSHIQAKLWIDKQDVQWTKANAEVLDTISIGWILARIGPGATISIRQTRLNDKDWLPGMIDINGNARVMLVKDHPIHEQISYYNFKPAKNETVSMQAQK